MPRKKIKNPITLFYPNNMLVTELSHDVTKDFPFKLSTSSYYLLFHILADPYLALEETTDKYCGIHSDILRDVLGCSYAKIIQSLIKHEYIIVDDYYSEYLGITKSYAIHPRLIDESKPFLTVHFEYDTALHNKMERIRAVNLYKPVSSALDDGRAHVMTKMGEMWLEPSAGSLAYVKEQYDITGNPNSPESYFHYFNTNPVKRVGVDNFGRRVHSVITNMPKVLRKDLRFRSDIEAVTVELDIVNSQPFFLSVINSKLINELVPECKDAIALYARYEANADYLEFKQLSEDGVIYERFAELYFNKYGNCYDTNLSVTDNEVRNLTKELIYMVFFGDYTFINKLIVRDTEIKKVKNKFFLLFQEHFKSVYKLFTDIKLLYWDFTINVDGKRKQYANNCLLAQRIESSIIYEKVITELTFGYGIEDVVTVHDCIIVKESEAAAAKAVFNNVFTDLNLNPKIK